MRISKPTEAAVVQNPLIQYSEAAGWTYISRDDATKIRKGETELVFRGIARLFR